jgi:SAM-dependent methyltransferase
VPGGISFDRVATSYDATRTLPPGAERTVADQLVRVLAGDRTLEVGVGTGRWALPLQSRGVPIVGVDLGRAMLRRARAKGFEWGLQGDVRRLPFRDHIFVSVVSSHVLHLVYDVPAVLRELDRIATGRMVSVLEYETAGPDVSAAYRALVAEAGPREAAPGLGERDLARRFPPDRVRDATVFHQKAPASLRIDALASRTFRDTWATPEPLHQQVIARLRDRYGAGEVVEETRVAVAEWSMVRLRGLADAWVRNGGPPADPAPAGTATTGAEDASVQQCGRRGGFGGVWSTGGSVETGPNARDGSVHTR